MTASESLNRSGSKHQRCEISHVVIVSPEGEKFGGGIGTVVGLISKALPGAIPGIKVTVINTRGSQWNKYWIINFGQSVVRLFIIIASGSPDVIHLNVSERGSFLRKGVLLCIGRLFKIPVILHHHGAELITSYRNGSKLLRIIVRAAVRNSNFNIVLGEIWREFLVCELDVDPDRVAVLYNATTDKRIARVDQSTDRSEPFRLLFLANLIPRKGVGELLTAVAQLKGIGHDLKLTLVGGGQVERYRRNCDELGISIVCNFTGWIPAGQVVDFLNDADALVLPSFDEGLPMSILEALSAGIPVIATRVGAIPEVLTSGVDSLLLEPGDVIALTSAIRRIITEPNLRQDLACAGRSLYESSFTQSIYIKKILDIYRAASI